MRRRPWNEGDEPEDYTLMVSMMTQGPGGEDSAQTMMKRTVMTQGG